MKNHNIALSLSEMNLSGEDIIQEFPKIKLETINTLLNNVLIKAAAQKRTNSKESLLLVAKRVIYSKRDFYLEK